MLGPMYKQPVRNAEDLAVLENIADGRLSFGVANGYRVEKFAVMHVPLDGVNVTPRPKQNGGPDIIVGGFA